MSRLSLATGNTRVLIVSGRADSGGGPEHIHLLARSLPPGYELHVVCPNEAPYWGRFSALPNVVGMTAIPKRSAGPRSQLAIARAIRSFNPHIVHTHGKAAGAAGRLPAFLFRKASVHTMHGIHIERGTKRVGARLYLWYERLASTLNDLTIFVSEGELSSARDLRLTPRSRNVVIVNGVDFTESTPGWVERTPSRIVYVGRPNEQKNPELALDVMEHLVSRMDTPPMLFMVGLGLEEHLSTLVAEKGLAEYVKFVGQLDSVRPLLRESHVFLSTSLWEGLPLAVLEAMSEGCVPVISDIPGHRELLENSIGGATFSTHSAEDAALAVEAMLDPGRWIEESNAAADRVRSHYSAAGMGRKTAAVYETLRKSP